MYRGYIKLWRKLKDWPHRKKPDYLSVWVTLLLNATHKPYDIEWCGERRTLQPGQLVTSVRAIQEEAGVHRASVQRILKCLESETQIEQLITPRSRLITIINWHEYQGNETEDETGSETLMRHCRDTDETLVRHNKNVKNVENVEEEESKKPPPLPCSPPEGGKRRVKKQPDHGEDRKHTSGENSSSEQEEDALSRGEPPAEAASKEEDQEEVTPEQVREFREQMWGKE